MSPVSERQQQILNFVHQFRSENGFPPSVREIGVHFGIKSPNGVTYHLRVLEREGLLDREPRTSRSLRPHGSAAQWKPCKVPVVGRVAAGGPNLAFEEIEREVYLDPDLFGKHEDSESLFALRVTGDSMSGVGIFEGDIAVVRRQRTANLGDIVVAMVEGEATIKRYLPRNGHVVLQPENDRYSPIVVKGYHLEQLTILGKVVGLLRTRV